MHDAIPLELLGTTNQTGEQPQNDILFPYWTLPQPTVYKLRTCCLPDFIPLSSDFNDNLICYRSKRLEVPSEGVAYLFRGRRYLVKRSSKFFFVESIPSVDQLSSIKKY